MPFRAVPGRKQGIWLRSRPAAVRPTALSMAAAEAMADDVAAVEARVAALHLEAQALNKQPGREADATRMYKELAALDDQALEMRLARACLPTAADVAAHATLYPAYCSKPPLPPSWQEAAGAETAARGSVAAGMDGEQLQQRALGAILGAVLGDAAACGVQWVYSLEELDRLAQGRPEGLEFYEPPQCPFFDYPAGSQSPYGEQTMVLLQSLAEAQGLDCCHYAAALWAALGPGFGGYRDRSTKSFLRRYAAGALPPLTGSEDDQANAFTRLAPLVALYAGTDRQQLLRATECMIRVTQDLDIAVAYGCAAALVLEAVILGSSVTAAVASTVAWLQQQEHEHDQKQGPVIPMVSGALWGQVAARLLQAAEVAHLPPLEAAKQLGRNCHLPNSLQTPLHVLMHLEHCQQQGKLQGPGAAVEGSNSSSSQKQQLASTAPSPAASVQLAADDGGFCLPCSMGSGTVCELPAGRPGNSGSLLAAGMWGQQWPAALPAADYVEAVRAAIRPGGCCASRSSFAGALAGALVGAQQLPAGWAGKTTRYSEVLQHVQQLVDLRASSS